MSRNLRLDNKAAIHYLNPSCLYDSENYRWVSGLTTYMGFNRYIVHNLKFFLTSQKGNSYHLKPTADLTKDILMGGPHMPLDSRLGCFGNRLTESSLPKSTRNELQKEVENTNNDVWKKIKKSQQ